MATSLCYTPFFSFKREFITNSQSGLIMPYYRLTITVYSSKLVGYCHFLPDTTKHEHQLFFTIRHANSHENKELSIYQLTSLGTSQPSWTASFLVRSDFQNPFQDYVIRFLKFEMDGVQEVCRFVAPLRDFFPQVGTRFKNLLAQCLLELKTSDMSYWMTGQSPVDLVMNAENFTAETEVRNEIPGLDHMTGKSSHAKSQQGSDAEESSKDETNQTTPIDSGSISDLEGVNHS